MKFEFDDLKWNITCQFGEKNVKNVSSTVIRDKTTCVMYNLFNSSDKMDKQVLTSAKCSGNVGRYAVGVVKDGMD